MAKAFKEYSYTTDAGTVVRIRMADSSAGITGQGTTTATIDDDHIWAYSSNPGKRRGEQLNARGIRLERTTGTGANIKKFRTFVPVTTQAALAALTLKAAITIDGVAYTIAGKISES